VHQRGFHQSAGVQKSLVTARLVISLNITPVTCGLWRTRGHISCFSKVLADGLAFAGQGQQQDKRHPPSFGGFLELGSNLLVVSFRVSGITFVRGLKVVLNIDTQSPL